MSNKIANSAAGSNYFNINGDEISDADQPRLDSGSIAGVATTSILDGNYVGNSLVYEGDVRAVSGDQKISGYDVDNVAKSATKLNEVYKIRDVKRSTAFRQNKFNSFDNSFDTNYPVTGDSTSQVQLNTPSDPTLNDDAIWKNEMTFKYSLAEPTIKNI